MSLIKLREEYAEERQLALEYGVADFPEFEEWVEILAASKPDILEEAA